MKSLVNSVVSRTFVTGNSGALGSLFHFLLSNLHELCITQVGVIQLVHLFERGEGAYAKTYVCVQEEGRVTHPGTYAT